MPSVSGHGCTNLDTPGLARTTAPNLVLVTGIAIVLAGVAIVSGVRDVLAAKLLGLKLLIFSALALAPLIFASPHDHASWGGNADNLTAVGSAWIVAEWLAGRQSLVQNRPSLEPGTPSLA